MKRPWGMDDKWLVSVKATRCRVPEFASSIGGCRRGSWRWRHWSCRRRKVGRWPISRSSRTRCSAGGGPDPTLPAPTGRTEWWWCSQRKYQMAMVGRNHLRRPENQTLGSTSRSQSTIQLFNNHVIHRRYRRIWYHQLTFYKRTIFGSNWKEKKRITVLADEVMPQELR